MKDEIKSLGSRFVIFLKNFAVFFFIFGLECSVAISIGILIISALESLGVPFEIYSFISRIWLTIAPSIPTLHLWLNRDYSGPEDIEGAVMDCCFMAWIVIIIFAWTI